MADMHDQHEAPKLTVFEWVSCRQAHNLPILEAVRRMLTEVEQGHIEVEERLRHGLPVH